MLVAISWGILINFLHSPNFLHVSGQKVRCWKLKSWIVQKLFKVNGHSLASAVFCSSIKLFQSLNSCWNKEKQTCQYWTLLNLGLELGCCNPDVFKQTSHLKVVCQFLGGVEALFYTVVNIILILLICFITFCLVWPNSNASRLCLKTLLQNLLH